MSKPVKMITACAACAAALGLGAYALFINKDKKSVPTYSDVPQTAADTTAAPEKLSADWADKYEYNPSASGMTARARSLLRLNKDVVGWIRIDETQVDYPIVIDPGEVPANDPFYGPDERIPNSFYLDHDLDRSFLREGALFADYRNAFGGDESQHSANMVIYGHAMWDGTMFGSLRKYRQNLEFYNTSPFVKLSSNYKDYDYVIVSFLITSGSYNATDFHYWDMENLDTEEDYDFYMDCCRRSQLLDTGVDVKYGDKLLTLSTCYADEDNSRFIVVARRLRDGETAGDMTTIQRSEAFLKAEKEREEAAKAETAAQEQQ